MVRVKGRGACAMGLSLPKIRAMVKVTSHTISYLRMPKIDYILKIEYVQWYLEAEKGPSLVYGATIPLKVLCEPASWRANGTNFT